MQSNECNYCGAILEQSIYQCKNCGGQVKPFVSISPKKRNKKIFFGLLFIVMVIAPFIYKRHLNNIAASVITTLQTGAVRDSSVSNNENIFYKKAQLSQVFAIVLPIKLVYIEFYMTEGRYPNSLDELGFDEKSFDTGELIENIQLSKKDGIRINLDSDTFGQKKYLIYMPKNIMGGMNIQWSCSSNVERKLIPLQCKSIVSTQA